MDDATTPAQTVVTLDQLKAMAIALGYSVVVSPDGLEERLVRPDGTVAVIARRKATPASSA